MTPCRCCGSSNLLEVLSLGVSPLANSYLQPEELQNPETFYPLDLKLCADCYMAQLDVCVPPAEIFTEYAYFSSWSTSWLEHARQFVEKTVEEFALNQNTLVIEIASNDGYLLQYFKAKGIPVLGIEPAANVVAAAIEKGIATVSAFWNPELADRLVQQDKRADFIVANNVLAHVPDLHGFVEALSRVMKPEGVATLEFPHLYQMINQCQFDTIYHEHYSYFALFVVCRVFAAHGLKVFDVEELSTHGGSLRVYVSLDTNSRYEVSERVNRVLQIERDAGMRTMAYYQDFAKKASKVKRDLLTFLIDAKENGKRCVGYGAAAKGNTLLNYCGIRTDFIEYVVDRSPAKQGRFTPGTRIPIFPPERIEEDQPDYVLILPWNLREEIEEQMGHIRNWGGRFVTAIPKLTVF